MRSLKTPTLCLLFTLISVDRLSAEVVPSYRYSYVASDAYTTSSDPQNIDLEGQEFGLFDNAVGSSSTDGGSSGGVVWAASANGSASQLSDVLFQGDRMSGATASGTVSAFASFSGCLEDGSGGSAGSGFTIRFFVSDTSTELSLNYDVQGDGVFYFAGGGFFTYEVSPPGGSFSGVLSEVLPPGHQYEITIFTQASAGTFGAGAPGCIDEVSFVGSYDLDFTVTGEDPVLSVTAPAAGDLVVAGEPVTIQWQRPASVEFVDVHVLPDTLGAAAELIDFAVEGNSLVWIPADTLFSRSARIVIADATNPALADTSDVFRIKPYHLARLNADSTRYEPFEVARHGWSFCNCRPYLFHPDWWQQPQFDYANGIDPLTFDEYDDDFPEPPLNALPNVFADWPAYARAYGTDAAYWFVIPGVEAMYRDSFTAAWAAYHGGTGWGGSCSGMAVASLLAFGHREATGVVYPAVGAVEELVSLPIGVGVRETINSLYSHWNGQVQENFRAFTSVSLQRPRNVLGDLKARLLADDRSGDGYLYLSNGSGAHAVVPYRLERISLAPTLWNIHVYDPNYPGDDSRMVVVDSTANSWSYNGGFTGNPVWSDTSRLYVMDPITNYLQQAVPRVGPVFAKQGLIPADLEATLYVAATPGSVVTLTALSGAGSVGYNGTTTFNTLAGAVADLPPVGGATPPLGFSVPAGGYALTITDAPDTRVSATIFDRASDGSTPRIYGYGRADADPSQIDQLTFDPAAHGGQGELTARSDETGVTKHVTLRAIDAGNPARERTLAVRDLALVGADSVRFGVHDSPAGPTLRLQNDGLAKIYNLSLREGSADGHAGFQHTGVPLPAGAVHTVRPVWQTLGDGPVAIDVDLDGDGTPEETIEVGDRTTGVGDDPVTSALPRAFALHPATPNPFNPQTTLHYDLPAAGRVRLAVYDVRGRLVRELVNGERPAGRHTVALDARDLPSGVYLVRLTAPGGVTATQPVSLVR